MFNLMGVYETLNRCRELNAVCSRGSYPGNVSRSLSIFHKIKEILAQPREP